MLNLFMMNANGVKTLLTTFTIMVTHFYGVMFVFVVWANCYFGL